MVGANKILTVSYGTFSCTLEGFDEPFSTMKAIAEYFRDLAADDRYFGAEPPTPDAEMLHRIAEREMHRRVDAKIEANGVTLRPQALSAPEADLAPTPIPTDEAQAVAQAPVALAEAAPEPQGFAESNVPLEVPERPEDSVAAKLARIRAAVANARANASVPIYSEDEHADAAPIAALTDDFGFDLDLGGPLADAAEESLAESPQAASDGTSTSADAEAATRPEPEAVEAVEAVEVVEVVEVDKIVAPDTDASTETEPATQVPEDRDETEMMRSVLAEMTADTGAAEAEAKAAPEPAEEDRVAALNRRAARRVARTSASIAALTGAVHPAEPEPEAATPGASAPLVAVEEPVEAEAEVTVETVAEAASLEMEPTDIQEGEAAPVEPLVLPEADEAFLAATEVTPHEAEAVAEAPRTRARVIKVRRAESEPETVAEIAAGADIDEAFLDPEFDEAEEPAAAEGFIEPSDAATTNVVLSPEAEAELARELADLEAEIEPSQATPDQVDAEKQPGAADMPAPEAIAALSAPRAVRDAAPEPAEADLSRLLSETNTQLQGSENRRRFSAIAHLKAAVAATVADRKLRAGDERSAAAIEEARDLERYRDDLTKAVRPRRPTHSGEVATIRPNLPEQRLAPLVLVSEQRIDRPQNPVPIGAPVIRPRRISVGQAAAAAIMDADDDEFDEAPLTPDEAKSFAEFAEKMGAAELPELLEAAAAYTASVEGRPHFSRPQIIKKVASLADQAGYDREAGLRSFGMLLRQGKIAKVRRGQFAITKSSRFYASANRNR